MKKSPGLVLQFTAEGEMYYSNLSIVYGETKELTLARTVWESKLDSTVIMKPTLVTNHYSQEKEILIQDAANTLSLLNTTGRVLWSIQTDGAILSDIHQVDYYDNGKLQYLFNTRNSIHLVDRNGNYVERYPVKLRDDATNGVDLFDYDNDRQYRMFLACRDRKVYAYDLEGNIVPGWVFEKSEETVTRPVQHFRLGDKDYLVFADAIRAYILDRRGNERVALKEILALSKNNIFYLDMNIPGESPRLISTDNTGNVIGIDFEGNAEMLVEHTATAGHYFRIQDLNLDGRPEYIYADNNKLEVLKPDGSVLFTYEIENKIAFLPDIYEFSYNDLKIGITDNTANKIYLVNSNGSLYEGFPLKGCTRFSIGNFAGSGSRFNLVVGSENGFLYNYSIE